MTTALIVFGAIAYMVVGLFVSRAVWRRVDHGDNIDAELNAFGAFLLWPTALLGAGLVKFVKWFYTERDA